MVYEKEVEVNIPYFTEAKIHLSDAKEVPCYDKKQSLGAGTGEVCSCHSGHQGATAL